MVERSRKICPLLNSICKDVNCMWYDKGNTSCSILAIAEQMRDIETSMPTG